MQNSRSGLIHCITPSMECCGDASCLCIPAHKEESIE